MRIVLNILILLTAALLLAGVTWQHREQSAERQRVGQTHDEVGQFHRVISLHTALKDIDIERSERGYPLTVDPAWFDDELPVNPLLGPSYPWLEIAHPDHGDLLHPPVRAASNTSHARFWYNPANGVVRARVPRAVSDAATLRLYNAVNGTNLTSLLPDTSRRRLIADDAEGHDADKADDADDGA